MKKTKKVVSLALAGAMAMSFMGAFCSCSKTVGEKVDKSRTQIRVFSYDGGFGTDWIDAIAKKYEELHKNDSYEDGKRGVQIIPTGKKETTDGFEDKIQNQSYDIYFGEKAYYNSLVDKDKVYDITKVVKATNPYADFEDGKTGRSIESKLDASARSFYDLNGKYYGLPHYIGSVGITYNVDLFDQEGYYFVDPTELDGIDVSNETFFPLRFLGGWKNQSVTPSKSKGPDGIANTYDDGLPATYQEFWDLCKYIKQKGDLPMIWEGVTYNTYTSLLLNSLVAQYEGEEMELNYTFNGTATDLIKIDKNGAIVKEGGVPVTESLSIYYNGKADNNISELNRQAGRYYGLDFIKTLTDNRSKYSNGKGTDNGYMQTIAQEDFLFSRDKTETVAMLIDGPWWENEARKPFNMMAEKDKKFSQKESRLAWMPLPHATEEKVGSQTVFADTLYSLCFVNKNVEKKSQKVQDLILDFLQFMHTDWSLATYTVQTNSVRGFNYTLDTLSATEKESLSYFGNTLWNYKQNSYVSYMFGNSSVYKKNASAIGAEDRYKYSSESGKVYPLDVFRNVGGCDGEKYFVQSYKFYRDNVFNSLV